MDTAVKTDKINEYIDLQLKRHMPETLSDCDAFERGAVFALTDLKIWLRETEAAIRGELEQLVQQIEDEACPPGSE